MRQLLKTFRSSRAARVAASRDDSDEIVDEASEEAVVEDVVESEVENPS